LFHLGDQFSAVVEERSSIVLEHLHEKTEASRDFALSDFALFSKPDSTSRIATFFFKKPSNISDERRISQSVVNDWILEKVLLYKSLVCP
ncbi:MAG: hypothetical protein WBC85_17390, partial [Planktotalea sp.]|uniref:hypothetical protein n=1 Tax=Planktotalea sp. TaxID=2029877 RepID=UPI003C76F193